ncbi:MAG: hypothetical protein Q7U74_03815 [Saprospiraceae bacterium]|nr:hypothetical protein [Saprospiraceae bacterium]
MNDRASKLLLPSGTYIIVTTAADGRILKLPILNGILVLKNEQERCAERPNDSFSHLSVLEWMLALFRHSQSGGCTCALAPKLRAIGLHVLRCHAATHVIHLFDYLTVCKFENKQQQERR